MKVFSDDQVAARVRLNPKTLIKLEKLYKKYNVSILLNGWDVILFFRQHDISGALDGGSIFKSITTEERAKKSIREIKEMIHITKYLLTNLKVNKPDSTENI